MFRFKAAETFSEGLGEVRQAVTMPQYCLVTVGVGIQTSKSGGGGGITRTQASVEL
jgi:hypothetical protein